MRVNICWHIKKQSLAQLTVRYHHYIGEGSRIWWFRLLCRLIFVDRRDSSHFPGENEKALFVIVGQNLAGNPGLKFCFVILFGWWCFAKIIFYQHSLHAWLYILWCKPRRDQQRQLYPLFSSQFPMCQLFCSTTAKFEIFEQGTGKKTPIYFASFLRMEKNNFFCSCLWINQRETQEPLCFLTNFLNECARSLSSATFQNFYNENTSYAQERDK